MKSLQQLSLWVFIGMTLGVALHSWYRITATIAPDFSVYYGAAELLWNHKSLTGATGLYTGFGYPPTTLLLFFPFLVFPYTLAQALWVTVSFLLLPICVYLSFNIVGGEKKGGGLGLKIIMVWSCLFFLSFPSRYTLGMGQINLLTLFFFLISILSLQRKREIVSGVLFFLVLLTKPHFILFLPVLFLLGYRKSSILSCILYILASLGVTLFFGAEYFIQYFFLEVPPLLEFIGRDIYYNQSLGAFFSRVFPISFAARATQIGTAIFYIGLLFATYRRKMSMPFVIGLFLPIFLLIEPLAWQHHFVFLLPVYMFFFFLTPLRRWESIALIVSYFLVSLNLDAVNFHPEAAIFLWACILSHALWGNGILLFLVTRKALSGNTNMS